MLKRACGRVRYMIAALVLLCVAALFPLQAEAPKASLSVGPLFTWGYSDIYEYVYMPRDDKWWKLSELDWDGHNTYSVGALADFSYDRFFFNVAGSVVIPSETGLMQDYDWMYLLVSNNDHPYETLTEFSEHEITLEKRDYFSIETGYDVLKKKKISILPTVKFKYLNIEMMGHDGYLQHSHYPQIIKANEFLSPYNPLREKYYAEGKVIAYQLKINSFWFGIKTDFHLHPAFSLSCEVCCSPAQLMDCYDYHYSIGTDYFVLYHDVPESVFMSYAGLSFSISLGKRSSLIAGGSVTYLPMALGNDYVNNSESPEGSTLGGAGYLGWDVSLSYRIRIF